MSNLILLLIISIIGLTRVIEREIWIVEEQSVLTIHGETNVNNFTCELPGKSEKDTLIAESGDANHLTFEKGKVKIDPQVFNCGNQFIKRDFLETIKADKYPYIFIDFINLKLGHNDSGAIDSANGHVEIFICGVTNRYYIHFDVEEIGKDKMILEGKRGLDLKEFNIETPSRMMGLIKVKDKIDIQFQLLLSKQS